MTSGSKWPKAMFYDSMSTIFDWKAPWLRASENILKKYGSDLDPKQFQATWSRLLSGHTLVSAFRSGYRDLTDRYRESLIFAMAYYKIPGTGDDVALWKWDEILPFPEANQALKDQQALTKVLILSNAGTKYLNACMAKLSGFKPDFLGDAEEIHMSKPSPRAYRYVLEHNNLSAQDVLHIAAGQWDTQGAMAYGMKAIWLNRTGETLDGVKPEYELKDMNEVTNLLRELLAR
jgi:2-haloacid dehalogenase